MADSPSSPTRSVDRLVRLPEHRVAMTAGRSLVHALAKHQRPAYDLLLVHGPTGVGKTHLVTWMTVALVRQAPDRTARIVPAAEFRLADERKALREVDLLVIEDASHLPAPMADALVSLLDQRRSRRRPTVVTANAGPGELTDLPARLTSRLASGLVVGLAPLSVESRQALLRRLCRQRGLHVAEEALAWLVARTGGGIRPLLGAVTRLRMLARQQPPPLTLPAVKGFWESIDTGEQEEPSVLQRIVEQVARTFRLEPKRLMARDRSQQSLWPRQVAMYLARELSDCSLAQIGGFFAGRDHTTVRHACQKVSALATTDAEVAHVLQRLRAELT